MSRIEDALKNAILSRSILEEQGRVRDRQDSLNTDNGINILIISRDLHISKLINNLQSLSEAELIASDDIALGMKFFFDKVPIKIDEYELRFTALMLENLCRHCERTASDQN
jgi:hypothetical protein